MKKTMLAVLAAGLLGAPVVSEAGYIYSWNIEKSADQSNLTLTVGQTFQVNYQVSMTSIIVGENADDIDKYANVSDSRFGSLGTVEGGDGTTTFFNYVMQVGGYSTPGLYEWTNIASFVTDGTQTAGQSSWTVYVTVPGTSVPEPGTLALLGLGLAGLGLSRRRKAA